MNELLIYNSEGKERLKVVIPLNPIDKTRP